MKMRMFGIGRAAVIGGLILGIDPGAIAQERTPIPDFTGKRVIVAGVPDQYSAIASQIARLEKGSPQSYFVVIVNSTGEGASATRDYADQLFDKWRTQGSGRRPSFHANRSVIVVADLEHSRVAVKMGDELRTRFGLHGDRVENDLIKAKGGFIDLAREGRLAEAISSLLDATNNWIAARDNDTLYVPVHVPASKQADAGSASTKALATAPAKTAVPPPERSELAPGIAAQNQLVPPETAPRKSASSEWLPVVIVGVPLCLMALVFAGWIWHLYRRAQGRVAGRIKDA
jgi:hypothetical protein